jgi:hypothetical protein
MIIGIGVMSSFLILVIMIIMSIICCRSRRNRLKSNRIDKNVKPYVEFNHQKKRILIFFFIRIISEPRLQNPYLLYSNSHYDYDYQTHGNNREHPASRSDSNPSSESSCITQNTHIPVSHYGFPPILSPSRPHQNSSSSENSTPNRIKKLFYEVVV